MCKWAEEILGTNLANPFSPERFLPHLLTELPAQDYTPLTTVSILDDHTAQLPAGSGPSGSDQALAPQAWSLSFHIC